MMRAAVQTGYGHFRECVTLREVSTPAPGAGEVLLRCEGATVNRKDLFALANLTGPGIRPRPPLPHVNGTDGWGTVAAVGTQVSGWHVGDRAVIYPGLFCGDCEWCASGETSACTSYGVIGEQCWGTHAEFVRVPARNLEPIPKGMTPEALACANGSWLTAWRALVTACALRPGEWVLVVGASGGVGTAAIRIATLTGARVIALVGSPWKAPHAEAAGAESVLVAGESIAERVRDRTRGRGVDVAIDSVGGSQWRETINALARFGRMAICGATAGDSPIISIREIYQQHRRIIGAPLGSRAEFRDLIQVLASGRLRPLVHATIPLEAIHDALDLLERRAFFGKIALSMREG
jgi:NADPH:quinone reductase-like Zn-dependent oxidoreductase